MIPKAAFICHSSKDAEEALHLVHALEEREARCWIAPRNIPAGTHYPEQIMMAVQQADLFVVILSDSSAESPHVLRELELAVSLHKPVIPIRLDGPPPSPSFTYLLASLQWIDASRSELRSHPEDIANRVLSGGVNPAARKRKNLRKSAALALAFLIACSFASAAFYFWRAIPATLTPSKREESRPSSDPGSSGGSVEPTSQDVIASNDSRTIPTLSNLASLYEAQGRISEAISLRQRIVALSDSSYGDHPKTADALLQLAKLLGDNERGSEAIPFAERALKIYEKSYGPDHPLTATSLNNLGSLLIREARYQEATPLVYRALEIRRKSLGPDGPALVPIYENLVALFERSGDLEKANEMRSRIASIQQHK